jgi:hypothetical protein
MDSCFELFDLQSGNVFDVFHHEYAALDALIDIEREHGEEAVRRFALLRCGEKSSLVAMEDALVELVASQIQRVSMNPESGPCQTKK